MGAALSTEASAAGSAQRLAPAAANASARSQAASIVDLLRPEINGRDSWADGLPVTGEIVAEEDVRFLLVHHTASTNDYGPDEVAGQIRDFYAFHTGPEKGWPDVAYNFFVDRYGGIWEARAGSIDGPVRGDATGGSQGFALLCSLIGNHSESEVTPEALASLTELLAWLGERYAVDTTPGATVDFVSRGSNRWPSGAAVTTAGISGHRDMSQTSCPGDATYALLATAIPERVTEIRLEARQRFEEVENAATTTTVEEADVSIVTPSSTEATVAAAPASTADEALAPGSDGPGGSGSGDDLISPFAIFLGAAATLGAVLLAGAARFRRRVG